MPGYGRELWTDRTPNSRRRTYPICRGAHTADVVVIGGGLTGCVAAYVAAAAGLRVILLEQGRLASAGTAASPGMILSEPCPSFRAVEAAHGLRVAKAAWRQARHGALDLAAILRRTRIRSDLTPVSAVINARSADDATAVRRELAARKAAGVEAVWVPGLKATAELGTDSFGALRAKDAFTFDPVRAALGLATAAERRGAGIFERSSVRRTRFDRKSAEVILADATIRTRQIFVATATPGALFGSLRRHFRQQTSFAVVTAPLSAPMRRETGRHESVVTEWGDSAPWLRWMPEDRVLFAGHARASVGPRQLDRAVIAHSNELMYELSVRYPVISGLPAAGAWPETLITTVDGLPWVGPHRNFPFHFFALGLGRHGAGLATYAARAAVRALGGESTGDDRTLAR